MSTLNKSRGVWPRLVTLIAPVDLAADDRIAFSGFVETAQIDPVDGQLGGQFGLRAGRIQIHQTEQPAAIEAEFAKFQSDDTVLQLGSKDGPPDLKIAHLETVERDAHLALKVPQHGKIDRIIEPVLILGPSGRPKAQPARRLRGFGKIAVEIDAIALDIEREAGGDLVKGHLTAHGEVPIIAREHQGVQGGARLGAGYLARQPQRAGIVHLPERPIQPLSELADRRRFDVDRSIGAEVRREPGLQVQAYLQQSRFNRRDQTRALTQDQRSGRVEDGGQYNRAVVEVELAGEHKRVCERGKRGPQTRLGHVQRLLGELVVVEKLGVRDPNLTQSDIPDERLARVWGAHIGAGVGSRGVSPDPLVAAKFVDRIGEANPIDVKACYIKDTVQQWPYLDRDADALDRKGCCLVLSP